jgi:hypothetical protein
VTLRPLKAAVETWTPGRGIAADPLHRIAVAWRSIVGASVAAHTEPIELNGTTLLVATRSSAWSQQLQLLSPAVLAAVLALPEGVAVTRLAFRSGGLRRTDRTVPKTGRRPASASPNGPRRLAGDTFEPAVDAADALARLRARMMRSRDATEAACAACGAPIAVAGERCAPCAGAADRERQLAVERTIYLAPWLTHAELREQFPDLSGQEFERARRTLLQRWWLILERVKRTGATSKSGDERQVASSYVLLQSRLPPDRITPAIVRNLIGDDVANAIWPAHAPPGRTGVGRGHSSNKSVR